MKEKHNYFTTKEADLTHNTDFCLLYSGSTIYTIHPTRNAPTQSSGTAFRKTKHLNKILYLLQTVSPIDSCCENLCKLCKTFHSCTCKCPDLHTFNFTIWWVNFSSFLQSFNFRSRSSIDHKITIKVKFSSLKLQRPVDTETLGCDDRFVQWQNTNWVWWTSQRRAKNSLPSLCINLLCLETLIKWTFLEFKMHVVGVCCCCCCCNDLGGECDVYTYALVGCSLVRLWNFFCLFLFIWISNRFLLSFGFDCNVLVFLSSIEFVIMLKRHGWLYRGKVRHKLFYRRLLKLIAFKMCLFRLRKLV